MPKEKVEFPTNTAVCVTLAYAEGKKVEGRYGDQFYYTLADGRCMYVPPSSPSKSRNLASHPAKSLRSSRPNGRTAHGGISNGWWTHRAAPPSRP